MDLIRQVAQLGSLHTRCSSFWSISHLKLCLAAWAEFGCSEPESQNRSSLVHDWMGIRCPRHLRLAVGTRAVSSLRREIRWVRPRLEAHFWSTVWKLSDALRSALNSPKDPCF